MYVNDNLLWRAIKISTYNIKESIGIPIYCENIKKKILSNTIWALNINLYIINKKI